MSKETISRREFLKLAGLSPLAFFKDFGEEETGPLTKLPVFLTENSPVLVEQNITRGGYTMDLSIPAVAARYPNEWLTLDNFPFDILDVKPSPGLIVPGLPEGSVPWTAASPHVTGLQPHRLTAVVGYSHQDQGFLVSRRLGAIKEKKDTVATYAFTDRLGIYPSKIYNILTALISIAEWQKDKGPMLPGQVVSYLEMSGATDRNRDQYLIGGYLEAGGICASVTTMSKVNFLAEAMALTKATQRTLHEPKIQYAENPLDPAITKENSDATVAWLLGSSWDNAFNTDYKFEVAKGAFPLYFSMRAKVFPDSEPVNPKSPARHRTQPADARLFFTLSLVRSDPLKTFDEIGKLKEEREAYARFHNFNDDYKGGFNDR